MDHADRIQKLWTNGYENRKVYISCIDDDEKLLLELMFIFVNRNFNNMREYLGDTEIVDVREREEYCFSVGKFAYALVPHHSGVGEWNDYLCRNTDKVDWIVTISEIGVRPYGKVVADIYSNDEELFICDGKQEFEYLFILV